MSEPPRVLKTVRLSDVQPREAKRITGPKTLPVFAGYLTALVGSGESGKSLLGAHIALDVAESGAVVLLIDGEMSAAEWRDRLADLNASAGALAKIHYNEMGSDAADTAILTATVAALGAQLIVWDSTLSLIARNAKSENDNAEVSRLLGRLRPLFRAGVAGLFIDHTAAGANGPGRARGATAKFNELDVALGVELTPGSIPSREREWSARITVEKDRHGLLPGRYDREATFIPIGLHGALAIDIAELNTVTNRFTRDTALAVVARIAALDPPPKSANEAFQRLGGHRGTTLDAFKRWKEHVAQ